MQGQGVGLRLIITRPLEVKKRPDCRGGNKSYKSDSVSGLEYRMR